MKRISRRNLLLLGTTAGALASTGCGVTGGEAASFEVKTQYGRTVRLSDFRGKPLLLTFWATWCPHCRRQMAEMQRMYSGYDGSRVGLVALSVDNDGWDSVRPYVAQNGISFPVGLATRSLVRGYGASGGIPVTYAISPQGRIIREEVGGLNLELLQELAAQAAAA